MRQKPTIELLVTTRRLWEAAAMIGRAAQKKVIDDAAKSIGLSYSAFTRHLDLNARKRSYGEAEEARVDEINRYARLVFDFQADCERDGRKMTTEVAYNALRKATQIPADVSKKRIYAAIKRLRLKNESASVPTKFRGQTKPLGQVQIDYSKSTIFMFEKTGRIYYHPTPSKSGSRLWIAAGIDDYSRVAFFKYYITDGENSGFVRDSMCDIFDPKEVTNTDTGEWRQGKVLCGLPKTAYVDRGKGNQSGETLNGLEKLRIKIIFGANEKDTIGRMTKRSNKKGRGKIERKFRHFKDTFEDEIVALNKLGQLPPHITLGWLNEQAFAFAERINMDKHPTLDSVKWHLFEASMADICYPPENARTLFAAPFKVRVYQRLIHVAKDLAYKAPLFVDDGDEVEVWKSGTDYSIWHGGKLVKLEPQGSSVEKLEEHRDAASGYYEGLRLRELLIEEIDRMSGGECSLKSLPAGLADDKKEFFEKPRSREDIRMKAQFFIDEAMREKKKYNIINYKEIQ